ncbi:MAG: glucose 1-dehydrogenase [Pseudomonadota bacterium]
MGTADYLAKIAGREAFDLSGQRALITGASRGIGEAIAKLFAAHGAHVIVSSRKAEGIGRVAGEISAAGGSAEAIPAHIGETDAADSLFAAIEAGGGLDILVNNAAANPYFGPVEETPAEAYDKTVDVNLRGYFYMSQLGAKAMAARGGGVILNTASVNGVSPAVWQGIYSISKAAIVSMTQSFAKELAGKNIRVNAVLPGLTETKFASAITQNEDILNMVLPQIPLQRVADPAEIAPAFLFLASDAARYVTGIALPVDGGYLA